MLKNMLRLQKALTHAEAQEEARRIWEEERSNEVKMKIKRIYDNNTKLFNFEIKHH
jgi:hypothetical protein